ncbi:hypothetical protein BCR35DRAFT_315370 [Leucosporidium creatinivorum]|uniref:Uncharacterized protein n=1 Tax=Leucosporidium creatinivorum TaxID=106004 RepID=A0A1Y2E954_9BASI|nr:hypothetical protein BCR35DRAFT_315370 [Leucosporidium creatinivorum]
MSTACDLVWGHLNPVHEIPSVTVEATAEEWRAAFRDREAFVHFLMSQQTVFVMPTDRFTSDYIINLMARTLQQSTTQENESAWNNAGRTPHDARPFCSLMAHTAVDWQIERFVKAVSARMVHAAKRVEQANKIVYLAAKGWESLNPLQRARGVLAAKNYVQWIKDSAPSRPGNSAAAPVQLSLNHHHLPSLTFRQARRSQVSEGLLRSRWA